MLQWCAALVWFDVFSGKVDIFAEGIVTTKSFRAIVIESTTTRLGFGLFGTETSR